MAKEAVEKVRDAEEEALKIVREAEQQAAALLAEAGESAARNLEKIKEEETQKMSGALESAKAKADEDFIIFKKEVSEKCARHREEILSKSEMITDRIIEAVKRG